MHSHWYVKILLKIVLLSSAFSQNWRTTRLYVTPGNHDSQVSCPVDHSAAGCYRFQDVISTWSYFGRSYTTLELLSGVYNITEKVGHLVLNRVYNFTLKGSSSNVTIICQPGATFGLTIVHSRNVEIANIQVSHCSAKLQHNIALSILLNKHYGIDNLLSVCDTNGNNYDTNANNYSTCYRPIFLTSSENEKVTIFKTSILHSKGVGIFTYVGKGLSISGSLFAYNQINCIIVNYVLDTSNTTRLNISQSQIEYGQANIKFASGLNLLVHVNKEIHKIYVTDVTFANNNGEYGNFYLDVNTVSDEYNCHSINVKILITNILSIQTGLGTVAPGIVIECHINFANCDQNVCGYGSLCISPSNCLMLRSRIGFQCWTGSSSRSPKSTDIVLQNSHFLGSCVIIQDSMLSISEHTLWTSFRMSNITISESRCLTAFSVVNCRLNSHVQLSDLNITNSRNNILLVDNAQLILTGNASFLTNQGSILLLRGAIITFKEFTMISGNTAHEFESIFQVSHSTKINFKEVMFINNTGRQGGAISAYSSDLYFKGNAAFIGNSADNGGAISLKEGAVIHVGEHILFKANVANMYGGAIYVEDRNFWARNSIKCFIHNAHHGVEFENNTAGIAGAALFGGWIDLCGISSTLEFKTADSIASNPIRVCICTNSTLNKYDTEAHVEIFPGQTFAIEVVAVGQRFGVIPGSVRAETTGNDVIDQLHKVQDTKNNCTKLKYTIRSSNRNETMLLSIDGQILPKWINESIDIPDELLQFKVFTILKNCPLGFEFDSKKNICSCQTYLDAYGVQCNFTTYKVNRNAQQWIGILNPTKIIVVHQHCPYDYCHPYALSLNLSTPDDQCSSSRSGILCGACQPGLSQVLGTSNCKQCSNIWLLLIFVFALAGILLVAGLLKLNITVSTGTINGLIFYANIVRANTATFFPDKAGNIFLSWFIAWLNLDIGIETCFYNGLDAYMKTWLRFAFPLYIWFLVILIIISSKYSQRAARLFGANAVQVLATLFLLSYAKLLRVAITIFLPTHLLDNHQLQRKVWHYDGNIAYLGNQHIILMIVALLFFVIFFIPYTLVLFAIQWLQTISHYKLFRWVNKLKPLFDAYTGPYKDKHRHWTGLLLLIRIGLFIVFSTNTSGDPAINLLAIIIVIICLFVYLAMFGGVYKNWLLNMLEYSSLLNLIILSVMMLYMTSTNVANYILSQVSVSITLCTTVLIFAYHGLVMILKIMKVDPKFNIKTFWKRNEEQCENSNQVQQCNALVNPPVTYSVIELTEPLLEC